MTVRVTGDPVVLGIVERAAAEPVPDTGDSEEILFPELTADLQRIADEDHARQPRCSWCSKPGEPYTYKGVRFDGLVPCQGERLCKRCTDAYLASTPRLVASVVVTGSVESTRVYDLNPNTWDWSEKNIPGCFGQPPVSAIAVEYRPEYADYHAPKRSTRRRKGTNG